MIIALLNSKNPFLSSYSNNSGILISNTLQLYAIAVLFFIEQPEAIHTQTYFIKPEIAKAAYSELLLQKDVNNYKVQICYLYYTD